MLPVILEVPRTSGESVAKDWGKGCAMGIGNSEAVCLDPGLFLLPEGWLMPLPHGIRRVYSFSVPSQGLHKSKHPLAVGPGSICQTPHSSTCICLLIPVRSFSIARLLPPARAGGARCCRRSGRPGPADATLLLEWLGKAPGCLPVSRALGVMQGWLALLSSFWNLSCSAAATRRNCVGEAQPSCSSAGLLGSVLIREGAAQSTAGLGTRQSKGTSPSRGCEFGNSQFLTSLRPWPLEPGKKSVWFRLS